MTDEVASIHLQQFEAVCKAADNYKKVSAKLASTHARLDVACWVMHCDCKTLRAEKRLGTSSLDI